VHRTIISVSCMRKNVYLLNLNQSVNTFKCVLLGYCGFYALITLHDLIFIMTSSRQIVSNKGYHASSPQETSIWWVIWTGVGLDQFQTSAFCLKQLNDSLTPGSPPTQRTAHYYHSPMNPPNCTQHSTETALVHLYTVVKVRRSSPELSAGTSDVNATTSDFSSGTSNRKLNSKN